MPWRAADWLCGVAARGGRSAAVRMTSDARLEGAPVDDRPRSFADGPTAGRHVRRDPLAHASRRYFRYSNTIGSSETMTMPRATSEKLSLTIGTLPNT